MFTKRVIFTHLFRLFFQTCLLLFFTLPLQAQETYSYIYSGQEIALNPSQTLVVIDHKHATKSLGSDNLDKLGIERDPLSDDSSLVENYFTLYRITDKPGNVTRSLRKTTLIDMAANVNAPMQPVFEQGGALLIPTAEIIVGFASPSDLNQAREKLTPHMDRLGIREIKELGTDSFLVIISKPGNGRVYDVCKGLSQDGNVSYAEPNHLVVMMNDAEDSILLDHSTFEEMKFADMNQTRSISQHNTPVLFAPDLNKGWQLLTSINGENQQFPPAGWDVLIGKGSTPAAWAKTDYISRNGKYSIYCAGSGPNGVKAPGPAPPLMKTFLRSPVYTFSQYNEVYIEVWFYAKNEVGRNAQGQYVPKDYPVFGISNGKAIDIKPMMIAYNDDCTVDPTTDKGWRKFLYRVPQKFRSSPIRLFFAYTSDNQNPREGVYLDDIRILGKNSTPDLALGNDPYAPLQYELVNTGQIAGLGNRNNDMKVVEAWNLTQVSPEIVVAVIDDGVELKHPDLNVVAGYLPDGSAGGAPPGPRSNHGTSVAGNIGAIRNNNVGVIGTAPNVKIMAVNHGGKSSTLALAIDTAVAKGARILNNSWGWVGVPSKEIEMAIKRALDKGVIVLFAAGNGPDRPPFKYDVAFPGSLTGTTDIITVGATSQTDEHKSASSSDGLHTWGSSYIGPGPDIAAPGPWSYTTDRLGELGYNNGKDGIHADYTHGFGGTSSATPKVAGIVALMLSANPQLTPAQVKQILRKTADDIDIEGVDDKTGAGRVNAYKAVTMAKQMIAKSSPAPTPSPKPVQRKSQPQPTSRPVAQPQPGADDGGWNTIVD